MRYKTEPLCVQSLSQPWPRWPDFWLFTSINGCRAGWGCPCLFPAHGWFEWPSSGVHCWVLRPPTVTELLPLASRQSLVHWENCLQFVDAPRCVSFFHAPNCINAPEKVNLKKIHPAAFYFPCPYTNGISLRIIIEDYIITQSLINETVLNLPL